MGTIRCAHGFIMENTSIIGLDFENQVVYLKSVEDDCKVTISSSMYYNATHGANFTHVFFNNAEEYKAFKDSNIKTFQFISCSGSLLPDGKYHLVY